jgi:hypothetical protein
MKFLSVLLGFTLYWLANQVFNQFMWIAFRCEALFFHDYSFLLEEEVNRHMIIGIGIFEQFDYLSMKTFILDKAAKVHKGRSNLVKKCGVYWYQEMTEEQWSLRKGGVVELKEGINSDE